MSDSADEPLVLATDHGTSLVPSSQNVFHLMSSREVAGTWGEEEKMAFILLGALREKKALSDGFFFLLIFVPGSIDCNMCPHIYPESLLLQFL
jgi:hypothetical protein